MDPREPMGLNGNIDTLGTIDEEMGEESSDEPFNAYKDWWDSKRPID